YRQGGKPCPANKPANLVTVGKLEVLLHIHKLRSIQRRIADSQFSYTVAPILVLRLLRQSGVQPQVSQKRNDRRRSSVLDAHTLLVRLQFSLVIIFPAPLFLRLSASLIFLVFL